MLCCQGASHSHKKGAGRPTKKDRRDIDDVYKKNEDFKELD